MKNVILILFIFANLLNGQSDKVKISGEYSYTFGDNESLIEAKEICYTMALRNAIETYQVFITSTATVKDYKMIKDLVKTISFGHVQDVKVIKEEVKGRKIDYKIEGYINPIEIKNVLNREVKKSKKQQEFDGILENRYIKIISVKEKNDQKQSLIVSYIIKESSPNPKEDLYINWYDKEGIPITTENLIYFCRMSKGAFDRAFKDWNSDAASYKLWFGDSRQD